MSYSYSVTIYNTIMRAETASEMVDIDAKLRIEISVKDYEQVVRNDKGRLLGTMTKVPGASSVVKGKVDKTIEEKVRKEERGTYEQTKCRT